MQEQFISLSKKSAQNLADRYNLIFRLVSVDGEKFFGYPEETDIRTDRICVEIEKGFVIKAEIR